MRSITNGYTRNEFGWFCGHAKMYLMYCNPQSQLSFGTGDWEYRRNSQRGLRQGVFCEVIGQTTSRAGNDLFSPERPLQGMDKLGTAKAGGECAGNKKGKRHKTRGNSEEYAANPVWPPSSGIRKAHLHLYCVVPGDASLNPPSLAGVFDSRHLPLANSDSPEPKYFRRHSVRTL